MFSGLRSLRNNAHQLLTVTSVGSCYAPVNDVEAVKMLKSQEQLGSIIPRPSLVELSFPLQVVEQLSSVDECQYEVQLLFRLEGEFQRHNERAVDLGEHGPLGECMRDFGTRDNVRLSNRLESVDSESVPFSHLHNLYCRTQIS